MSARVCVCTIFPSVRARVFKIWKERTHRVWRVKFSAITESAALCNLLRWPLKTNKKEKLLTLKPDCMELVSESVCDPSALNAASPSRPPWFRFSARTFQKGWWMSRLRQALYGKWVNRLVGAVHHALPSVLRPQKLLNNVLRKPQ